LKKNKCSIKKIFSNNKIILTILTYIIFTTRPPRKPSLPRRCGRVVNII